jgi:hypothetical protein
MSKNLDTLCNILEHLDNGGEPLRMIGEQDATREFCVCWFRSGMARITANSALEGEAIYNATQYNQVVALHDDMTANRMNRCVAMYDSAFHYNQSLAERQDNALRDNFLNALDHIARQASLKLRSALNQSVAARGINLEWAE